MAAKFDPILGTMREADPSAKSLADMLEGAATTAPADLARVQSSVSEHEIGVGNTRYGARALEGIETVIDCTAVGTEAFKHATTGVGGCAYGRLSCYTMTDAGNNTGYGDSTWRFLASGVANLSAGYTATEYMTAASYCVYLGAESAKYAASPATYNTATGTATLIHAGAGSYNSVYGAQSAPYLTGSNNLIAGANAAVTPSALSLSNMTLLGYGVSSANNLTDSVAIGKDAAVTRSNQVALGGPGSRQYVMGNLQMSSLVLDALYKQVAATLWDFEYGLYGTPWAAAVRTSAGTYIDASGVMQSGTGLRVSHGSVYREPLGLVIESAATNLAGLSALNAQVTAAQTITVAAVPHTVSFYGAGTVTLSGVANGPIVGDGAAYRKTATFTPGAGGMTLTPTGDVRNLSVVAQSWLSSHIPNAGSGSVTRTGDHASAHLSGADFTRLFPAGPSKGTIVVYFRKRYSRPGTTETIVGLSGGNTSGTGNALAVLMDGTSLFLSFYSGSVNLAGVNTSGGLNRVAFSWDTATTTLSGALNGSGVSSSTSSAFTGSGTTSLILGALTTAGQFAVGACEIPYMRVYPGVALTGSDLAALAA